MLTEIRFSPATPETSGLLRIEPKSEFIAPDKDKVRRDKDKAE